MIKCNNAHNVCRHFAFTRSKGLTEAAFFNRLRDKASKNITLHFCGVCTVQNCAQIARKYFTLNKKDKTYAELWQ